LVSVATRGLTVRYRNVVGVEAIDLSVPSGEIAAIVGPNGSGKSSLLKAIAGVTPCDGAVALSGRVAHMPQDVGARAALTVMEAVLLGRLRHLSLRVPAEEIARAGGLLASLGLAPFASRLLGELSGGQRQLVFLAQALASDPGILLLDEPTSALDLRNALELMARVRREAKEAGRTVLVAIHDLNAAARFADRIVVLAGGRKVADGAPREVLTAALLAEVYGVEADVHLDRFGHPSVTPLAALA
jgi:iron complex transport system ATP-binding protein